MYRFARFTLDTDKSVLFAKGLPVALARKVVETLTILVERVGGVVSKEEILARLWPDGCVEESNITQNIYLLRQALRAHGLEGAIENVPRRGYRFAVPVEIDHSAVPAPAARWRTRSVAVAAIAFLIAFGLGNAVLSSVAARSAAGNMRENVLSAKDAQLYGLGRYYWSLRSVPALRNSIKDFTQVVLDDPASALGYAGMSDAYLGLYDYQCESRACPEIGAQAKRYAAEAVIVDPSSAQGLTSLAMVLHVFEHDDAAASAIFQRAIAADPRYALAHEWYGNELLVQGRLPQARAQLETAAALDPVSPATYGWLARAAYFERKYADAIVYAQRALSISPDRFESRVVLGLAYQQSGDDRRAISEFTQLSRTGGSDTTRALLAGAYAHSGQTALAERMLAPLDPNVSEVALAYVALHRNGVALADIKKIKFRNPIERAFFRLDPRLDEVRGQLR